MAQKIVEVMLEKDDRDKERERQQQEQEFASKERV